jgi:cytochrome c oxidase subunit 4
MNESLRRGVVNALLVWGALLILLALTVGTAFIPLGAGNTLLNVGISALKTVLIATFFMHLREPYVVPRLICAVALVMLSIQLGLSGVDYATRVSPVEHGGAPVAERRHGPSNSPY